MSYVVLGLFWFLFIFLALKIAIEVLLTKSLTFQTTLRRWTKLQTQFAIWLSLVLFGYCFSGFLTGFVGIVLTLALPVCCYVITFAPFLSKKDPRQLSGKIFNGVLAGLCTMAFWNLTVTSANWKEGSLAFVAIIPLFFILLVTTVIALHFVSQMNLRSAVIAASSLFAFLFVSHSVLYRFGKQENLEVYNKLELAKALVMLVKSDRPIIATEISNSDRITEVYAVRPNGNLQNKYGGEILINDSAESISIKYTKVPAGDACHSMYYVNNPSPYGFKETFVDGIRIPDIYDVQKLKDLKERVCFSNTTPKTIEFRGTKKDLLKVSNDFLLQ